MSYSEELQFAMNIINSVADRIQEETNIFYHTSENLTRDRLLIVLYHLGHVKGDMDEAIRELQNISL